MSCFVLMVVLGEFLAFPLQPDIGVEKFGEGPAPIVFFAPHENEYLVNDHLAQRLDRGDEGLFLIMRQRGKRHVYLSVDGQEILLDPNRMFTRAGVQSSLSSLNPEIEPTSPLFRKARSKAVALGRFVLSQLGLPRDGTMIIAIHNNTDGYDGDGKAGIGTISINRYIAKQVSGARYIADVYVGTGDEDDLFFVTSPDDFAMMSKDDWNVILQNPKVAVIPDEDDGSLSVYAEMYGMRYVNIEAQRASDEGVGEDHTRTHQDMLNYLLAKLRE